MKSKKELLAAVVIALATVVPQQATAQLGTMSYSVMPYNKWHQNEGWGVSLCWWANMCGNWSDSKIDQLVTWLVSPEGLNCNIFRASYLKKKNFLSQLEFLYLREIYF